MAKYVALLLVCLFASFATGTSAPVLVELFTSEGCSSCPPADALLQSLDRTQPLEGAQLIVLSEHVTYWNHDGWVDRYSSDQLTGRQADYVKHFGVDGSYTPEMVVDGESEFVPGNAAKTQQALEKARSEPKLAVRVPTVSTPSPDTIKARVEVDALPDSFNVRKAEVYVVIALREAESQVAHGENGGKHLSHVNVVQKLTKIGNVEKGKSFADDVELKLPAGDDPSNIRVIAFVQQPGPGKILGSTMVDAISAH
jgi:hypothetical protein